ncbi:MAG: NAD-dependent succinate-semialdehyde dehydrogenase [Gammaproteobacteria bacterium]|nr:NAD-dependent succinate-semialdehyde dehydrogenase [Gammaproteobacteria bacterium]
MQYEDTGLYIGGEWRPAISGAFIPVENPATGQQIGQVAKASTDDLDLALTAVQAGFDLWRRTAAFERASILRRAATLIRERADRIAEILTLEQGKPLTEARTETLLAGDVLDWFAGEAQRTYGQLIPARSPSVTQAVHKLPVGPVAAFTPWNFPINQTIRKLAAALAAGCAIIVKGPEETPASPAALVQALADAGVPAGVVNLVYGVPAEISSYLIPHPVIRKASFTGSVAVGKQLAELAGRHMKRTTMELGGHAPVIICDDADVQAVVALFSAFKFRAAGQTCISPTRFLVHRKVHDEFVEGFIAGARNVKVGDGFDPATRMGPLINLKRVQAVQGMVDDAVAKGAKLETGGRRIGDTGYFYEPTILTGLDPAMRIMNEEPFGPVALVSPFDELDAAITEANRLPVGLGAFAFTSSARTAHRLANEIESGMITINHIGMGLPEVPFGGIKDSGYGSEGGSDAIEPYLVSRFVTSQPG